MKEESKTQHWTLGLKKEWKREKMGKEIKEESRKGQQERRKQRSWLVVLLNTSCTPKSWLKCLPVMKMGGNKTSTISQLCGSQIHSIQIPRERHTFFEIGDNIKQNEWQSGERNERILGLKRKCHQQINRSSWGTGSKTHAEIYDLTKTLKYGTEDYRDP